MKFQGLHFQKSIRLLRLGLLAVCLTGAALTPAAHAQDTNAQDNHAQDSNLRENAPAPVEKLFEGRTDISQPFTRKRHTIVQTVPSVKNIHHVKAAQTPSGFVVPRYVSLKFNKFNGRSGPSQHHPIVWQYRRSGLPVIVIAETENWRKIRDMSGDESWVHKAGLSGERFVISRDETSIMKRPNPAAYVTAIAEPDALLRLESCEAGWCKVFSTEGHRGWAHENEIWGATPLF